MIELTLPCPPSVNKYWRNRNGRTLLSKDGRVYKKKVYAETYSQKGVKRLKSRLRVEMVLHPPNKRKWDLDNRLKALLDAMQYARVYEDDEQIDDIHLKRGSIIKGGLVRITIEEV